MMRAVVLSGLALGLAACGGGDEPADPEAVMRELAQREAAGEPAPAPAPAEAPADGFSPETRAELVQLCVENTVNDAATCGCAADRVGEELTGDVRSFFLAQIRGEREAAQAILPTLSLEELQSLGTATQVMMLQCGLRPAR